MTFAASLQAFVRWHPGRGYGEMFRNWVLADGAPACGIY
jgi:hypothetical protein